MTINTLSVRERWPQTWFLWEKRLSRRDAARTTRILKWIQWHSPFGHDVIWLLRTSTVLIFAKVGRSIMVISVLGLFLRVVRHNDEAQFAQELELDFPSGLTFSPVWLSFYSNFPLWGLLGKMMRRNLHRSRSLTFLPVWLSFYSNFPLWGLLGSMTRRHSHKSRSLTFFQSDFPFTLTFLSKGC
jgi:hypothetical protein